MTTLVESDQASDTWLTLSFESKVRLTLLSMRSQEAQAQGLPCQDYVRILSNEDGSSLSFCVCDGVGSSYHGGFAARYLAQHLVDWLYGLTSLPAHAVGVSSWLEQWANQGQDELTQLALPTKTPAMLRGFLENLRDTYGSQAVFLCGRVDAARVSEALPAASPGVRGLFYWMGNITARIFAGKAQQYTLGDVNNDKNRWSTIRGPQGIPGARVLTMETLDRILIYTDGLGTLGAELSALNEEDIQARTQELLALPAADDRTVLDLRWVRDSATSGRSEKASRHE